MFHGLFHVCSFTFVCWLRSLGLCLGSLSGVWLGCGWSVFVLWADFLVGRLGAFRADLAPSGPIWRLLGRFGALGAGLGALWLGLWCSWLVSCLACGACGRLVRAWCAHGARMRGDVVFNRALPPPVQKWEKTLKRRNSENSVCRGNAAFLL